MTKYIVIHEHAGGTTSYLVEYKKKPTISQLVRCLDLNFEPSREEGLIIDRVAKNEPITLDWQDSDAEEFEEFADEDDEDHTDRAIAEAISGLELVVDDEDEDGEVQYLNHYRCAHEDPSRSGHGKPADEWTMVWSCMCNDKCPTCNAEIEPYKSDELPAPAAS
jgi:hypothetical protein